MSDHDKKHAPSDEGWFDKPKNVKLLLYGLYAACALSVLVTPFIHFHPYFDFEKDMGAGGFQVFFAVYGFVAFAFIVLAGQHLRKILMRSEDYYDKRD